MNIWQLPFWRATAFAVLFTSVSIGVAGERIVFSKPDHEILPAKPPAELPNTESHSSPFAPPTVAPAAPYIPPPPVVPSRKAERRTLFDTPDLFADKDRDKDSPIKPNPPRQLLKMPFDRERANEPERALSPISQYDWTPEADPARGKLSKDPSDSKWSFEPGVLGRSRDEASESRENSLAGFFNAAPKHELTRSELDRKAEWEQLLHPSLPPVSTHDAIPGAAVTPSEIPRPSMPLIAQPDSTVRPSLDPMQNYNDQQRRWSGPSVEDMNRKAFGLPAAKPEKTSEPEDRRTPLMRQPIIQDFPARRF
jgi:hypothetical protein